MENPKAEGNYTTIFADGSVILENHWIDFGDGHGKWYWNETFRGGVIAWNEIPEGGYKYHRRYKIPEWELRELVRSEFICEALEQAGVQQWEGYDKAIKDYCDHYYYSNIDQIVDDEIINGYYKGFEVK